MHSVDCVVGSVKFIMHISHINCVVWNVTPHRPHSSLWRRSLPSYYIFTPVILHLIFPLGYVTSYLTSGRVVLNLFPPTAVLSSNFLYALKSCLIRALLEPGSHAPIILHLLECLPNVESYTKTTQTPDHPPSQTKSSENLIRHKLYDLSPTFEMLHPILPLL